MLKTVVAVIIPVKRILLSMALAARVATLVKAAILVKPVVKNLHRLLQGINNFI
jgi:hypothetical protein